MRAHKQIILSYTTVHVLIDLARLNTLLRWSSRSFRICFESARRIPKPKPSKPTRHSFECESSSSPSEAINGYITTPAAGRDQLPHTDFQIRVARVTHVTSQLEHQTTGAIASFRPQTTGSRSTGLEQKDSWTNLAFPTTRSNIRSEISNCNTFPEKWIRIITAAFLQLPEQHGG